MKQYATPQDYEAMSDLERVTLLPEKQLIDFLESNTISIQGLRDFWLRFGRFPTKNEQVIVMHGLIDSIPYPKTDFDLSKISGSIKSAKKPFSYVQVMLSLFILFVLLHYAGCMTVVKTQGL